MSKMIYLTTKRSWMRILSGKQM